MWRFHLNSNFQRFKGDRVVPSTPRSSPFCGNSVKWILPKTELWPDPSCSLSSRHWSLLNIASETSLTSECRGCHNQCFGSRRFGATSSAPALPPKCSYFTSSYPTHQYRFRFQNPGHNQRLHSLNQMKRIFVQRKFLKRIKIRFSSSLVKREMKSENVSLNINSLGQIRCDADSNGEITLQEWGHCLDIPDDNIEDICEGVESHHVRLQGWSTTIHSIILVQMFW